MDEDSEIPLYVMRNTWAAGMPLWVERGGFLGLMESLSLMGTVFERSRVGNMSKSLEIIG